MKNETETGYSGTKGHIDRSWKETEYLNPSSSREFASFSKRAGKQSVRILALPSIVTADST